ncbi:outer membrane protein [Hoeflea olei]|uniref:Outer membrane protein beta-barrel domain-containing protein n=1 Tax=Hoeflea olei TaxID=1480615 RepID=A0A1C1YVC7_9HYPH|nr:outer membrane beta-barrel protein [Hoeflea olei]OCW57493.1 hypothetical protein AWJ14_13135 [Hoeflea olei]
MVRHVLGAAAFVLALGTTSPLLAADATAPFDPTGFGWDGAYVGVQLGYDWLDADGTYSAEVDDGVAGLHAGYLFRFGDNVYVGPEVSAEYSGMKHPPYETDHLLSARLRGGMSLDRFLFTGSVGVSQARFSRSGGGPRYADTGWLVGAGVDYAITDRVTAGIDYSHHSFSDFDGTGVDVDMNVLRARLGLKF